MADTNVMIEVGKYFAYGTLLMPGIIMITLRRWVTPINCKFFSHELIRFIGYGFFNFAVFLAITRLPFLNWNTINIFKLEVTQAHPWGFLTFTFILPFILGGILCLFDRKRWINKICKKNLGINIETSIATAWEETFAKGVGMNVDIRLKNDEIIHGYFGEYSLASTYLEKKDIYLENVTAICEKETEYPTSMWIDGNEIVHIDFVSKSIKKTASSKYILAKMYVVLIKIFKHLKNNKK